MSKSGWNIEIDNMFIGDFNNMIKNTFGEECYNNIRREIKIYNPTNESITEYKKKVSEYLIKNEYMIF